MLNSNIILQPAYFAPIAQYAAIIQASKIVFEIHDHFTKQSYRNRCYIFSANGSLLLNVPIKKNKGEKTISNHSEISYAEDWQSLHLKSLQSAYQNSPFYEYYEPEIIKIFRTPFKTLGALHKACHNFVMDTLQEEKEITTTTSYDVAFNNTLDLRGWIDCKKKIDIELPNYIQMFDDKHGFKPNLSILDLIFMEGPAAVLYLEKIILDF